MDNKKIKNYIINEFRETINNNICLLTEKWSISDEVENEYDRLISTLYSDIKNCSVETIEKGLLFYSNTIHNYKVLDRVFDINYFIYNCSTDNLCDFVYNEAENLNGFQEDENILNITLYMINNIFVEKYCEKIICHEMEHIIQINYGYKNNSKYKKLMNNAYDYANNVIRQENGFNKYDKLIAWLIYYSNSHEQDAFMQEYAKELKRSPSILFTKKSETHNILYFYSRYCNEFLSNIDDKAINKAISNYKIYGYNITNFKMMATKQLNRFKKKMNNIEKNFKLKNNTRII